MTTEPLKWAIYPQYRKGAKVAKPKPITKVTLSSDTALTKLYAWKDNTCQAELYFYKVNFSRDGFLVEGLEMQILYGKEIWSRQAWWVTKEEEKR